MNKSNQCVYTQPLRCRVMAKLALLTCLFISLWGVCYGYDLYVDDDASSTGADGSLQHPYPVIQSAVSHACTIQENVAIHIETGFYSDPVIIEGFNNYSISLIGVNPRFVTIDGEHNHTPIKVTGCSARITITGIDIINGLAQYDVINQEYHDLTYDEIDESYVYVLRSFSIENVGGGLFAWHVDDLYISDCNFTANSATQGGGLFSCASSIRVDNSSFIENTENLGYSNYGAALCVYMSDISASETSFLDNGGVTNFFDTVHISQLDAYSSSDYTLDNCIFTNNNPYQTVLMISAYSPSSAFIKSCTFTANHLAQGPAILLRSIGNGPQLFTATLENNIIYGNVSDANYDGIDMNLHQLFVPDGDMVKLVCRNNDYHDLMEIESILHGYVPEFHNNIDENPLFINPEAGDFSLIWTTEARSPLIMAGYGNEGLGSPYHADRLDIGAVQYSEHPHEYVTYTFPPYSERNGLKWMSFPTLDRIWNPATNEPDVANIFFTPIRNPLILNSITWKVQDDDAQDIHYDGQEWEGDFSHYIIPQQGYKIQMAQGLQTQQNIAVPGIIPEVTQYPLTIKAQSASKATDIDNENWLGYFNQNTTHVCDAFTGIIDNLWFIQTQNWTMVRQKKEPGSPWIMDYQWGKEPTLSYGDMVIVKCFTDDQFFWNTAAPSQDPVEKELPQYYVYEEKPDYVPLYVELDSNNLPKEIALYVDDVCKGAAVVSDSLVEIPAYILDGVDPNSIVELRCIYNDKASVDQIPAYRVWNPESNSYENKTLTINRKNYYYMLKLEQNGNNSPILPDTAISVYPNPFNPNTTIRFCLPEASKIKLEIYNQKGQLVKSLAQGNADSGWHSKVWNGTDSHNRKVASGLYYSKLSYNGKSIMKKMVLLK